MQIVQRLKRRGFRKAKPKEKRAKENMRIVDWISVKKKKKKKTLKRKGGKRNSKQRRTEQNETP